MTLSDPEFWLAWSGVLRSFCISFGFVITAIGYSTLAYKFTRWAWSRIPA